MTTEGAGKWLSERMSRVIVFTWTLFIVLLYLFGFVVTNPSVWQKIINPWKKQGLYFCSAKYQICVNDEPKWSVKIPPRDFLRRQEPIISFRALNFDPARIMPDVEAEVFIPPPEKLRSVNYEISNPLDYLLLLQQQYRTLSEDLRVVEQPAARMINGREFASERHTFRDSSKENLEIKTFVFLANRKAYAIFYRAKKSQFEKHLPEAMKIIESFRPNAEREVKG